MGNEDLVLGMVQGYIDEHREKIRIGSISDGHHTFDELYEFRKFYNAALFNEWANQEQPLLDSVGNVMQKAKYDVHKSWRHNDGQECFGGGWFVVVAVLPSGQISNHYEAKDWDLFRIPESETAEYPFDGHTSQDVMERLAHLLKNGTP